MKQVRNFVCGAACLFIITSASQAQLPSSGGTNMQFVPVDTNRNLAAPIPSVPTLQKPAPPKKPLLARIGDRLAVLNPFHPKQPPAKVPGPLAPSAQLPKDQQPPTGTTTAPTLPSIPPLVQGSIR